MKPSFVCQLWHEAAKYLFAKRTCVCLDFLFERKRKHKAIDIDNFLDKFEDNVVC